MKFDKYSPAFEQDYVLFLSSPLHCFHQKLLIIVCCTAFYTHLFIHSWCDCLKSCWHRCRETKMKIYVIIELRAIEFDELSSIPVSRKEGLSLAVGVGGGRIACLPAYTYNTADNTRGIRWHSRKLYPVVKFWCTRDCCKYFFSNRVINTGRWNQLAWLHHGVWTTV